MKMFGWGKLGNLCISQPSNLTGRLISSKLRSSVASGFELVTQRMHKRKLFGEMTLMVPWAELV